MSTTQQRPIMLFDMSNATHRIYHRQVYASPTKEEPNPRQLALDVLGECSQRAASLRAEDSIAVFDGSDGAAYRRQLWPDYKKRDTSERSPVIAQTLDGLRRIMPARGFRCCEEQWFEADDVIGGLARQASARSLRAVIVAADLDLAQCIDPFVSLLWTGSGKRANKIISLATWLEEYDYHPRLVADYKALAGDASDTLVGVPGIGDGYATELVRTWGDLGSIYLNLAAVGAWKKNVRTLLERHREQAMLMLALTKLRQEVPTRLY